MNGNIDLDVYNYDLGEIVEIVNLHPKNLTKKILISKLDNLIDKYDNNEVIGNFFIEMKEKVSDDLHNVEDEDLLELGDSDEDDDYLISNDLVIDEKTYEKLTGESKVLYDKINNDRNKSIIKLFGEFINIRSQDRPIINYIDVCDPNSTTTKIKQLGDHTNFDTILAKPIKNVVELNLKTLEIPYAWYTFSDDYGTNYFSFKLENRDYVEKIQISSGNYNVSELLTELQTKSDEVLPNDNLIKFTVKQNKMSIKNLSKTQKIKIEWSSNKYLSSNCYGGAKGQKINYNMGWLLGFRSTGITIKPGESIEADVLMDIQGPRYLVLVIEDYINNKPNNEIIATKTNTESYKLPKYWNKITMGKNCEPVIIKNNGCHLQKINYDLSSNLTQKQKYTVDQIKTEINNEKLDIYQSSIIKDVFAKIPVYYNNSMIYGQTINMENIVDKYKRIYFGPVNLKKLKIKLLDERGNSINLNGMDFSFTLEAVRQKVN
jgi:hypothetical protein